MEAVARGIAQAQHEIFITDWCMNPEIFLRRPSQSNTWRLDKLLQAKAVSFCLPWRNCLVWYFSSGTNRILESILESIPSEPTAWRYFTAAAE